MQSLRSKATSEEYLVDPASSHMLVSRIKPCMCKIGIDNGGGFCSSSCSLLICERLIKQVMNLATWNNPSGIGITLLTAAIMPTITVELSRQ
jgi:hypothetical protein